MGFDGVDHHRRARHGCGRPRARRRRRRRRRCSRAARPAPTSCASAPTSTTSMTEHGHRPRGVRDRRCGASNAARARPQPRAHRRAAHGRAGAAASVATIACRAGGRGTRDRRRRRAARPARSPCWSVGPAGSMACFNVTWGIADALRRARLADDHDHRVGSDRAGVRRPARGGRRSAGAWSSFATSACTPGSTRSIDTLVRARPELCRGRRARLAGRSAGRGGRPRRHPRRRSSERAGADRPLVVPCSSQSREEP